MEMSLEPWSAPAGAPAGGSATLLVSVLKVELELLLLAAPLLSAGCVVTSLGVEVVVLELELLLEASVPVSLSPYPPPD